MCSTTLLSDMSTVNATQTQTRIAIKKPIKELKILEVRKKTYNIIRSFVESSSKLEYEWNTGIKINNKVVFTKTGKWRLIIDLEHNVVILEDYNTRDTVLELNAVTRKLTIYNLIDKPLEEFDLLELLNTEKKHEIAVINRDVMFARPILLSEILDKLFEYVEVH